MHGIIENQLKIYKFYRKYDNNIEKYHKFTENIIVAWKSKKSEQNLSKLIFKKTLVS